MIPRTVALLAALFCLSPALAQTTATWNGNTGNWSDPTLWSTNPFFPNDGSGGVNYNASLNGSGTLTLTVPITIESLSFSNGTITGPNSLTLNAGLNWNGGTFAGAGASTTVAGTTTITGGQLGRNLTLNGPATWTGSSFAAIGFTEGTGATLTINNTFTDATAGNSFIKTLTGITTGLSVVVGSGGTYSKTGTSTTLIAVPVNVAGAVQVNAGTLSLSDGSATGGSFAIGSGATLSFGNGTYTADAATTFSGSGTLAVPGGSVALGGSLPATLSVAVSGGTLGGNADLTINGPFDWSSGTLTGNGTTTVTGSATFSSVVSVDRNLKLNGPTGWSGSGPSILFPNVATLTIGATFTDSTVDGDFIGSAPASLAVATGGTYAKTGSGTTIIEVPFTNAGAVSVQSGTLSVAGGGSGTAGSFSITSGAVLQFTGGTYTVGPGTSFTGFGTVALAGNFVGTVAVSGPFANTLSVSNTAAAGTLNFDGGPYTVANATVSGTLGGNANLAIAGGLTLSNGVLAGAGATTTVAGATMITGGGFLGRNLILNGSATWTGSGLNGIGLMEGTGATLTVNNTFTDATTGTSAIKTLTGVTAGLSVVIAANGTYSKTGSGTTTFAVPLNNAGAVQVTAGVLALSDGGAATAGSTFTVSPGADLQFVGGTFTGATSISGASHVTGSTMFSSGNVALSGAMTVGSTLTIASTGNVSGSGNIQVASGGTLTVQGTVGVPVTNAGVVNGNATFTNNLIVQSGGALKPGNSPGTITVGGNIVINGDYDWDIDGNDNTLSGSSFDKVSAGGTTTVSATCAVKVNLGNGVNLGNSFWSTRETWTILTTSGRFADGTLPQVTVTPPDYLAVFPGATFSPSEQGGSLNLTWNPGAVRQSTWSGASSGSFSDPTNWAGGIVPDGTANGQLVFGATTNSAVVNDLPGTLVLNAATFTTAAPAYALSGNPLEFRSNSAGALPQIVQNSPNAVTISTPVTLTNGLTVSGSGNLSLTGVIGGPGTLTYSGAGTLTLSGANTYSGGTSVLSGTMQVSGDAALGTGPVSGSAAGTLLFTASTTTSRSFGMNGGTLAVDAGRTLTLAGSTVSAAILDGPGTFATGTGGAALIGVSTTPSATLTLNNASDRLVHDTNGGTLNVAAGLASPVTVNGLTNSGSGTITVGAGSGVNASNLQSYGTISLANGPSAAALTLLTNTGGAPIYLNAGSRTMVGTPTGNGFAKIDLNGQNLIVAGGLLVNNGTIADGTSGSATIIADYGSLVKGAGTFGHTVITQNGGRFQAGNSPGKATFGDFTFGPGGVTNYVFAIDDAIGVAGPKPDALGHVSGWGLVSVAAPPVIDRGLNTTGGFSWTADPRHPVTVALETLINPTTVGADVPGPMADFDPSHSYTWPAVTWAGSYTGPTVAMALDAATNFDTTGFVNPVAGSFGWSLDPSGGMLSLTYTPSAVPEPGTFFMVVLPTILIGLRRVSSGLRPRLRNRWARTCAPPREPRSLRSADPGL
jgi:autotransporter-associated beta strand protein